MSEAGDPAPPASPPPRGPGRRRIVLIAGLVGAIVAAALVVVLVVVPGRSAPHRYTSLPAPCALVTKATLTEYVSSTASSVLGASFSGTDESADCSWSGIGSGAVRLLSAQVVIYRSLTGVSDAQRAMVPGPAAGCQCTVTTRSVTGVGDQALEIFTALRPRRGVKERYFPGGSLGVRSGNALIVVNYAELPYGPSRSGSLSPTADLAPMIAAAHDALAALAGPAGPPVSPAVTSRYAVPADPCHLVTAKTLARYLPAASVRRPAAKEQAAPGEVIRDCGWSGRSTYASLSASVGIFDSADGIVSAQQRFQLDAYADSADTPGATMKTTTTGSQPVTGLGAQAIAIFHTTSFVGKPASMDSHSAELLTWSGNAELDIKFTYDIGGPGPLPARAAQLASAVAVTRDVLAALHAS
jgi:hypothetical protein